MLRRRDNPSTPSTTKPVATDNGTPLPLTRSDVEIANRGADAFLRLFYRSYDGPTRHVDIPKLYRATSTLTWNGTALEGSDAVDFLVKLPPSHHEVQSYDCHPVPGTTPPALLITVSGTVMHGSDPARVPEPKKSKLDEQARVFSQTFLLLQDAEGSDAVTTGRRDEKTKGPRYYIKTDNMRFVG